MAASRSKTQVAIGSTQWIQAEREQLNQLIEQEVEEFGYSARNELEWLNEHMAEIFSQNQMHLTEVFKTPGKLRGKTPRTARKKDPQRAPLTDLFAPNPQAFQSPARSIPFYQKVAKIQVATQNEENDTRPAQESQKSQMRTGKQNTDSGYHGMTEDEMDVEAPRTEAQANTHLNAQLTALPRAPAARDLLAVENRSTEESFVSAREGPETHSQPTEEVHTDDDNATVPDEDMQQARFAMNNHIDGHRLDSNEISIHEDEPEQEAAEAGTPTVVRDSASDVSSPEKPLVRKSSLNFASLPPRETLTGKPSMGARTSQMQAGQARSSRAVDGDDDDEMRDANETDVQRDASEAAAAHNKTSTQRLHERINMLGQTREARTSKSITATYPTLPQLPPKEEGRRNANDEDDDWIAPISNRSSQDAEHTEPDQEEAKGKSIHSGSIYGHQKSISTATLASPAKIDMAAEVSRQKSKSVSIPNEAPQATATPTTSPKKPTDGPLSASKARLYSMLKSAKGMFASSAGASAQAKLEASSLSAAPSKESLRDDGPDLSKMPGGFNDDAASTKTTNTASSRPFSAYFSPSKEGRKTRSSTESDRKKEKKAMKEQKSINDLDKAREKERKKAAQQKEDRERVEQERLQKQEAEKEEAAAREAAAKAAVEKEALEQAQQAASKSMAPPGKLKAPGRLVKPARQAPPPSTRPVPVNIRVASQSQRLGSVQPSNSAASLAEPTPPPGARPPSAAGRPGVARAGSAAPAANARVKALEAAARKKEQEEKAAAKKAEQKKELERKRAAKLEEERRAEQERKAEEQRKAQEARAAAQRQAEQRKLEQQRREAAAAIAAKAKAEAEMAEALEREKARAPPAHLRGDLPGTIRQLGKTTVPDVQPKNGKRPLQREPEEQVRTSTLNRGMPSYQQQDAKRRRTDDEDDDEMRERHSVMAPPKRPSNMRKETLSKFPHGYAHAPPPAAHHAQNIYKASVATQPIQSMKSSGPMQPHETVKLSTARIPFAENANPPAMSHPDQAPQQQATKTPTATTTVPTFKTPARPPQNFHHSAKTKSSPAYPNGDAIALPEINTDSESDSDDSDGASPATRNATQAFRAPSWVASPALRDLLTQQQLVDPESVFGPIAALNMDEVFRAGTNKEKERMRRYRERGESAMWVESGDAVTSAEKRRDREARERVVRDGGWSFSRDL